MKRFDPGDIAYVGKQKVEILKQVLFNRPAYKVKFFGGKTNVAGAMKRAVVDGCFINKHPGKGFRELLAAMNSEKKRRPPSDPGDPGGSEKE